MPLAPSRLRCRRTPLPARRSAIPLLAFLASLLLASSCETNPRASAEDGSSAFEPERVPGNAALFSDLDDFTGLPNEPRASATSEFWEHWGDGRAELSGYRVTTARYGEPREGELSLIYVTEPHDRRSWIKDDAAESPDRVEVLKLIRTNTFLTGIYPYSVMSSTFAPVDHWREERFQPVRINLEVQEWCGSVSHRVWPGPDRLRSLRLSYFASEGETLRDLEIPRETLYEDALLIQLRELDSDFQGGGDWEGWIVPELWQLRTGHGPIRAVEARITRSEVRRGGNPVTRFVLDAGDYQRTFDVEREPPRRVLGWTTSTGEEAELIATERLAYWELNRTGDESYREELGLSPLASIPPGTGGCP